MNTLSEQEELITVLALEYSTLKANYELGEITNTDRLEELYNQLIQETKVYDSLNQKQKANKVL